jgi:hypothetical protein
MAQVPIMAVNKLEIFEESFLDVGEKKALFRAIF